MKSKQRLYQIVGLVTLLLIFGAVAASAFFLSNKLNKTANVAPTGARAGCRTDSDCGKNDGNYPFCYNGSCQRCPHGQYVNPADNKCFTVGKGIDTSCNRGSCKSKCGENEKGTGQSCSNGVCCESIGKIDSGGQQGKTSNTCYYDSIGDINGKTLKLGSTIHVAGWGGICRSGKYMPDRVDVHICNEDGSGCVGLKGSINRNNRSESVNVQQNLCGTSNPGNNNKLGFDDLITIPTTITTGRKRIKVVNVAYEGTTQLTAWCKEPVFTLVK